MTNLVATGFGVGRTSARGSESFLLLFFKIEALFSSL
jgi:hypothetical protein